MIDPNPPVFFFKKTFDTNKINNEIDQNVNFVGERIIKRFKSKLELSSRKLEVGKIISQKSLHDHDSHFSIDEHHIGLRDDFKIIANVSKDLAQIKQPYLQELLICLAMQKNCNNSILEFAIYLSKNNKGAMEILGKLILLLDKEKKFQLTIDDIVTAFDEELKAVLDKLEMHYLSHKKSMIQSADIALMTQLSIELAQLIMTKNGGVNFGIIPSLIRCFVDEPQHPLNYEINIVYTLNSLLSCPALRQKLGNILKPNTEFIPSNRVIRAVLDLPITTIPTDLHAQQTALSALLSHVRQGTDGSCFATPLVIGLLFSELDQCLDDFALILRESKLIRKVKNVVKDIPFLMRLNNKSLNHLITIDKVGKIYRQNKPLVDLWEVPGFIKACQAVAIENYKDACQGTLNSIFADKHQNTEGKINVTVIEILEGIADYSFKKGAKSPLIATCFAFEGQICNPLLGVWENSIAAMAEVKEGSHISSNVINVTLDVLKAKLDSISSPDKQEILKKIEQKLIGHIHMLYDPIINGSTPSKDLRTTQGAFVLHTGAPGTFLTEWKRVDTPGEFKSFILDILSEIDVKELNEFVNSDAFLENIINQYKPKTSKSTPKLSEPKKIKYAPWITKTGHNFSLVAQIYLELPEALQPQIIKPNSTEDLFDLIVTYTRGLPEDVRKRFEVNPNYPIAARITGVHAFTLILGHPTFCAFWKSSKTLKDLVIKPGENVANKNTKSVYRKKVVELVQKQLLATANKKIIEELINLNDTTTICQFRNHICKYIENPIKSAQILDRIVYQELSPATKRKLNHSAVHIGDSNWNEGLNDLHFCFVINPGTGKLEIWTTSDDKSALEPMIQSSWLKPWEIFSPFKLIQKL